jgi:hypothetical protein
MRIENISFITMVIWRYKIILKLTLFLQKSNCWWRYSVVLHHWQVSITCNICVKNGLISSVGRRQHQTDTPGSSTTRSSSSSGPVHTFVSTDSTVRFNRPKSKMRKGLFFITRAQTTHKIWPKIWTVIHGMESSWYLHFPLLMPQNATHSCFRNTNLKGTSPYRCLRRLFQCL